MKKVAIIINKNWEAVPVLNAFFHTELRAAAYNKSARDAPASRVVDIQVTDVPPDRNYRAKHPRAVIKYSSRDTNTKQLNETLRVSIWCIQDIMFLGVPSGTALDTKTQSTSSSNEKYHVLADVIREENPDLVIAVGTAGYPGDTTLNGSVVIGANFFIHRAHPKAPTKDDLPNEKNIGSMLYSNVNKEVLGLINKDFRNMVEPKFIKTPRNPAEYAVCIASKVFTAVSSVGVIDYAEYNWVDREALEEFHQKRAPYPVMSVETTHGVIKLSTDKPIIFVSAISDQLGHFDTEVTDTQNYVASFNAGIVLGQLMLSLNDFVIGGNDFIPE